MNPRMTLVAIGIATTALVGGAAVAPATAASVKSVLLGRSNKTDKVTTIQNTDGAALSLKAPKGTAPLAVSNSTTVKNLSADRLDGLSSGSFARSTGRTGTIAVDSDRENGSHQALCPPGTVVTGGGGVSTSGLAISAKAVADDGTTILNGWEAYPVNVNEEGFIVLAECYSPSGKPIPGSLEGDQAAMLKYRAKFK